MYIQKTTFSMKTIILARLKRLIQLTCAFVVLQEAEAQVLKSKWVELNISLRVKTISYHQINAHQCSQSSHIKTPSPHRDITPMLSPWRRSPMVTNGAITEAQRRLVLPPIYKLLHQIPPGPALITPAISSVNSTIWIKWSGLGLGAN